MMCGDILWTSWQYKASDMGDERITKGSAHSTARTHVPGGLPVAAGDGPEL